LPNCQQILQQTKQLHSKLRQLDQHKQTTIKMAVIPTFSTYHVFQKVLRYMNAHPEIDFQLLEAEGQQILSLLKNKQVDLAFYRQLGGTLTAPNLAYLLVRKEAFALCVAADDPLAKRKQVNLSEISGESFIMLDQNSHLYQPVEDLCQQAGFRPNVVFTSQRISSILEMVKNHQGVAILMNPDREFAGIKFVSIAPTQGSYLYLLRQKDRHNQEIDEFWDYLNQ
jgi:DNA-binding transcriptional LysR family regulator